MGRRQPQPKEELKQPLPNRGNEIQHGENTPLITELANPSLTLSARAETSIKAKRNGSRRRTQNQREHVYAGIAEAFAESTEEFPEPEFQIYNSWRR